MGGATIQGALGRFIQRRFSLATPFAAYLLVAHQGVAVSHLHPELRPRALLRPSPLGARRCSLSLAASSANATFRCEPSDEGREEVVSVRRGTTGASEVAGRSPNCGVSSDPCVTGLESASEP